MLVSPSCNLRRKLLDQFALSHSLLLHVWVSVTVRSRLASGLLGAECNVGSHGPYKACDKRTKPRKPCWRACKLMMGRCFNMFVILPSDLTLFHLITETPVPDTWQSAQFIAPNALIIKLFLLRLSSYSVRYSFFYALWRGKICELYRKMNRLFTARYYTFSW